MQREDPLTGEQFVPRRMNQRFASRSNQVKFNNLKAARKRKAKARHDRVLDKNRNILQRLLGDKKEVVLSKDYLLGAGFNFRMQTHSLTSGQKVFVCIYDYAYTRLENNQYKIVRL